MSGMCAEQDHMAATIWKCVKEGCQCDQLVQGTHVVFTHSGIAQGTDADQKHSWARLSAKKGGE